jgi:hypothetical protein
MILIGNKKGRITNKVMDNICWKGHNIMGYNIDILAKQAIDTYIVINSNYLIRNIYDDINR